MNMKRKLRPRRISKNGNFGEKKRERSWKMPKRNETSSNLSYTSSSRRFPPPLKSWSTPAGEKKKKDAFIASQLTHTQETRVCACVRSCELTHVHARTHACTTIGENSRIGAQQRGRTGHLSSSVAGSLFFFFLFSFPPPNIFALERVQRAGLQVCGQGSTAT